MTCRLPDALYATGKDGYAPGPRGVLSGLAGALLAAGADVNTRQQRDGFTPLHNASERNRRPAVIEAFLAAGGEVSARDSRGRTPLHVAAGRNTGAAVGARDEDGFMPLHRAAESNGNPAVVEALLGAGADINARADNGWTPLHAATRANPNPAVVEALLAAGGDANARDEDGRTPWDLAQENARFHGTDVYWRLNDARFDSPR